MRIEKLFYYPIKGLTPRELPSIHASEGKGFPGDRQFALLFEDGLEKEGALAGDRDFAWQKKHFFANQNDWPALSSLDCRVDNAAKTLTVFSDGHLKLCADLRSETDLKTCDAFFTDFIAGQTPHKLARHPKKCPVRLVGSLNSESRYPDGFKGDVSIMNLQSLRALEQSLGQSVAIERFRGNIIVDGGTPWQELDWIGQTIEAGSVRFQITAKIGRCSNVNVHPTRGVSDLEVLDGVARGPGRGSFGVFAKVLNSGTLKQSLPLSLLSL
jgi:uncharacterized protein